MSSPILRYPPLAGPVPHDSVVMPRNCAGVRTQEPREGYSSFPTDEFFQLSRALPDARGARPPTPPTARAGRPRASPFPSLAQILDFELALLLRRRRIRRLPRLRLGVGHRVLRGRRAHAQLRELRVSPRPLPRLGRREDLADLRRDLLHREHFDEVDEVILVECVAEEVHREYGR